MNEQIRVEAEALLGEIARYLAVVDVFRAAGCEPAWLPESAPCRTPEECTQARAERAHTMH